MFINMREECSGCCLPAAAEYECNSPSKAMFNPTPINRHLQEQLAENLTALVPVLFEFDEAALVHRASDCMINASA